VASACNAPQTAAEERKKAAASERLAGSKWRASAGGWLNVGVARNRKMKTKITAKKK